jgi:predicted transcriptional regulator
MRPSNKHPARLDLVLDAELRASVSKLAERHDRSVSAEVRLALREYVEREAARDREEARAA